MLGMKTVDSESQVGVQLKNRHFSFCERSRCQLRVRAKYVRIVTILALLTCFVETVDAQPYASLRMDSLSGQRDIANDETGEHPGVYMNRARRAQRGAIGGDTAVAFNGVDQYVRVPDRRFGDRSIGRQLGQFTVEFWYRGTADNRGRCVLGSVNDGANTALQIECDQKTGQFLLLVRSEGGPQNLMRAFMSPQCSAIAADGRFHHFVWVVEDASEGRVRVYFDGAEDLESTISGTSSGEFRTLNNALAIGASNVRGRTTQFVSATLDEVAIYPDTLSADQIRRHFTTAESAPINYATIVTKASPLAYWRLGEYAPQNLHLLLDDRNVARMENAVLRVGHVEKHSANPLFGEEHPWEVMFNNLYPNVIFDQDSRLYKVWYGMFVVDSAYAETTPAERTPGTYMKRVRVRRDGLGYAVSKDGIDWEKPMLDEIPWANGPSNLVSRDVHGAGVFKDLAERDPARRYKMLFRGGSMSVRFSPDGIHWGDYISCPEINAAGDTHNNAVWNPDQQRYVGFTRLWKGQTRVVGRTESRDFVHWTPAKEILRGEHLFDVYSMPVIPYAGVYLGLPAVFDEQSDRVHTELAWSPDTIHWHRINPGSPLIPNATKKGDYDWGTAYASRPIVTSNGIRLYYGGCDRGHFDWRDGYLCLATTGLDRFAGFEPIDTNDTAIVETPALPFSSRLRMTADALGGSIIVMAIDADGSIVATSDSVNDNVNGSLVSWTDSSLPILELVGQPESLRFRVDNARLYSFLR